MTDLGFCQECGDDLSGYEIRDLPDGNHGVACPECGEDAYCGYCGDLTVPYEVDE